MAQMKVEEIRADVRPAVVLQSAADGKKHFCPAGRHYYTCRALSCRHDYEHDCGHCGDGA